MIYHEGPEGTENYGGTFVDETFVMDGKNWLLCVFERCILFRDDSDLWTEQVIYSNCTFIGKGWPNMSQGIGTHDIVIKA